MRLRPGFASARSSEPLSNWIACPGITPCRRPTTLAIVCGPAIKVKRPVATINTDGIAKNVLYASADASMVPLFWENRLPADDDVFPAPHLIVNDHTPASDARDGRTSRP